VQRTALCEFPKDSLLQSSEGNGGLVRFLRRALSKELNSIRCARLQLATPRADTRVASFVAWYASALAERRLAANRFHLPMSRVEIANHLGLAVESVSRALADLRAEDVLETRTGSSDPRLSPAARACVQQAVPPSRMRVRVSQLRSLGRLTEGGLRPLLD